jgi:C4-dicarboxylate-specific signal transduction histidine kinase
MLSGPASEGSLRVKAPRRGRAGVVKPLRSQELLGGMAAHLSLGAELHRIQSAALRIERRDKHDPGELGLAELLGSIAHEVNQPLAAVAMSACACQRWLQAQPPNLKKAQEALKQISRDAERAAQIIARIKRLALGEPLQRTVFSMSEVIRESATMVREKVRHVSATLRIGSHSPGMRVRGDRVQVQQVLLNLLNNALESLEQAPEAARLVRVESQVLRQEAVLVSIRDSGCGLTGKTAERMFQAFFTTKPGSMGLGLAICRSIIEHHGGRLWATPNQKLGTTFRFTLPLHR